MNSSVSNRRRGEQDIDVDVVLDALPCAALVCDSDWRIQRFNLSSIRLLQTTSEALLGRSLREMIPALAPDQGEGAWLPLNVWPAQSSHPIACLVRAQHTSPGGFRLVLITCDEGRQELCRHVTEGYYRLLFSQAGMGLATLDPPSGHILQGNSCFARMLGFEPPELAGRRLTQLLHGDDQAAFDTLLGSLARGERHGFELECLAYQKAGEVVCLHLIVSLIRTAEQTPVYALVGAHDLTTQRREEQIIKAAEARFRLLFEHNVAGMFRATTDGRMIECNEAFARIMGFGYPAQVLEKRAPEFFATHEGMAAVFQELSELIRLRNLEVELRQRNGSLIWALLNAWLVPDADGELTIIEGSILDITDRKRSAEQARVQLVVARRLANATDLDEALAACLEGALSATGMDSGGIYLTDETGGMRLAHAAGVSPQFVAAISRVVPGSTRMELVKQRQPVYLSVRELPESANAERGEGLRCMAAIPIHKGEELIGCFNLASHVAEEVPLHVRAGIEKLATEIGNAILRILAESEVRKRERELAALFNSMRDMVFVADASGHLLDVNRSACAHLGLEREALVGQHVAVFHPPEDATRVAELFAVAMRGHAATFLLPLVAKDGTRIPAEFTTSRGTWGNRAVLFGVARVVRDQSADALPLQRAGAGSGETDQNGEKPPSPQKS